MKPAIQIEKLSKKYWLGRHKDAYATFRETLYEKAGELKQRVFHPFSSYSRRSTEELWALRDLSFEIKKGEKVGIIGRNGAGKTTLLKILSRITEPTKGRIVLNGRVASLLEVGTGFHPELTGRENIYLNGAILGMTRREIKKRFDAIVSFAETEKFLDTPVKRYSSGMYVRLAFAIAAHLEPEILIVDEVLAVGDYEFQKKCLGKMEDVGREGRTVLFVSHQMAHVASLCTRAVLLEEGRMTASGTPSEIIHTYLNKVGRSNGIVDFTLKSNPVGDDKARLLRAKIVNEKGEVITESLIGESFKVVMDYEVLQKGLSLNPNFHFYRADRTCMFVAIDSTLDPKGEMKREPGVYRATCIIPGNLLNDGVCYVRIALTTLFNTEVHYDVKDCMQINIVDPIEGTKSRGLFPGVLPGAVRPVLEWTSEKIK